jgi:hypothetical protein
MLSFSRTGTAGLAKLEDGKAHVLYDRPYTEFREAK